MILDRRVFLSRPLRFRLGVSRGLRWQVTPNSITEKREQDEDRIFAPRGQAIRDLFLGHDAFHEAFLPHLTESAGEAPGWGTRAVPKELAGPRQLPGRHAAQGEP